MAITECKECGKDVSTKAKKCPNCGAPVIKKSRLTWKKSIILGLALGSIVFIANVNLKKESSRTGSATGATITDECRHDLRCLGENQKVIAETFCPGNIEKLAKHSSEWTDGMMEEKITHYRWKDKDSQIITFIGDKIKFQNGFGAWSNMIYECDIDAAKETVLSVRVTEGRL